MIALSPGQVKESGGFRTMKKNNPEAALTNTPWGYIIKIPRGGI
jgi:hypothetical protein